MTKEVRHASRNADSACPFLYWRDGKNGHAESAFRDACRTSSGAMSCRISHVINLKAIKQSVWSRDHFASCKQPEKHGNKIPGGGGGGEGGWTCVIRGQVSTFTLA